MPIALISDTRSLSSRRIPAVAAHINGSAAGTPRSLLESPIETLLDVCGSNPKGDCTVVGELAAAISVPDEITGLGDAAAAVAG